MPDVARIHHVKPHLPLPPEVIERLPALPPQRAEFVRQILAGNTVAASVRAAYPRSKNWGKNAAWSWAHRVKNDYRVMEWFAAARQIQPAHVSHESHQAKLERLYETALDEGNLAVARSVAKDQAELARLVQPENTAAVTVNLLSFEDGEGEVVDVTPTQPGDEQP